MEIAGPACVEWPSQDPVDEGVIPESPIDDDDAKFDNETDASDGKSVCNTGTY